MPRAAPQRRQGETKASARRRARATGRCEKCGGMSRGRICGKCMGALKRRSGPKRNDRQ